MKARHWCEVTVERLCSTYVIALTPVLVTAIQKVVVRCLGQMDLRPAP